MREPIFDMLKAGALTAQQYATAEARAKAAAKLLEPHFPKEVRAGYLPPFAIRRERGERSSNQAEGLRP
jgi:hypothetical protein